MPEMSSSTATGRIADSASDDPLDWLIDLHVSGVFTRIHTHVTPFSGSTERFNRRCCRTASWSLSMHLLLARDCDGGQYCRTTHESTLPRESGVPHRNGRHRIESFAFRKQVRQTASTTIAHISLGFALVRSPFAVFAFRSFGLRSEISVGRTLPPAQKPNKVYIYLELCASVSELTADRMHAAVR